MKQKQRKMWQERESTKAQIIDRLMPAAAPLAGPTIRELVSAGRDLLDEEYAAAADVQIERGHYELIIRHGMLLPDTTQRMR